MRLLAAICRYLLLWAAVLATKGGDKPAIRPLYLQHWFESRAELESARF
ncbi:hypothetical protein Cenrod_0861 [Candidatus Symbiobacter mobilis CR]|uniref:Uncharacterized protein n=1 Tax=Candidatus Symbiobacter mobilis CR TaxID=946483 RepID=U5N6Q7_9BURK|nr:hypothetical protein Cenrod_0861 [Candidatus Symbiobacter mobilis CR]